MYIDPMTGAYPPTPSEYDHRYGCEFYNMLWGLTALIMIGQVIPAYNAAAQRAA